MLKRFIILFVICLTISGCYKYDRQKEENNIISIDKINLKMEYKISSKDDKIREIVMFEECGRPDVIGSNTVIGAHSGSANYAYFNDIHLLDITDQIEITYNEEKYIYEVSEVIEVDDNKVDILENTGNSILTLLTCKIGDNTKRIVVISNLIS